MDPQIVVAVDKALELFWARIHQSFPTVSGYLPPGVNERFRINAQATVETWYAGDKHPMFRNFYEHCGERWEDVWDAMSNDECPVCGKEIEPYESRDELS